MSGTPPPNTPVTAGQVWTVEQWNALWAYLTVLSTGGVDISAVMAALATLTAREDTTSASIAATNSNVGQVQTALIPIQANQAATGTAIATLQSSDVSLQNALAAAQAQVTANQLAVAATQSQVVTLQANDASQQAAVTASIATLQSTSASQGNAISTNAAALAAAQSNLTAAQAQVASLQSLTTTQQNAITALQNAVAALQGAGPTIPNAPTGLSTGTITSTTIVFNWIAPATGPAPTGYVLQRSLAGANTYTTANTIASTAVTVTTTPPGATGLLYDWRVFATNASGSGPASSPPVTIGTLASVPTAPTGLAGVVSGLTIAFTWVAGAGGSAATGYLLERSPAGTNTWTTAATTTAPTVTATVTPPGAPGTLYDWRVSGTNGSGTGPPSALLLNTGIPATVPTQPTGLAAGVITSTTIAFSWVAGAGGTPATGYTLQRSPAGAGTFTTAATTTAPTVTATVTPPGGVGTQYDWQVFGTNAVGSGPVSTPPVTAGTVAAVPTAPTGLAGVVSGLTIAFTWVAGAGGSAATGYTLQRSPTGANTWTTAATTTAPTVTATVTPPGVPGTIYDWRVLGTNGSGSGPPSNQITLGIPATVPTAPTGLAVGVITPTTIAFSWVAGVGGTPATGYTLQRSPAGAGTYTTAATTTAPTVTVTVTPPGTAGTQYDWQVFATNAVGAGPVSTKVTAGTPPVIVGTRLASNIPFSSTSVWNIGIGSGATWGTAGNADVTLLRSLAMTFASAPFTDPIYFGGPSDPLVTVSTLGNGNDGDWPFSTQMHVPANATIASGDGSILMYDSTQPNVAVSLSGASYVNGTDVTGGLTSFRGALLDVTKNGISRAAGDFLGTDDDLGGVITDYDLAQGAITHMVRISISTNVIKAPAGAVDGSSVGVPWPNYFLDYFAPEDYTGGVNSILAGSTFGIPASVNLASLGLTTGGLMLATCLQKYGAIWRDSGGTSSFNFYTTPESTTHPLITQANSDGSKIMAVINIMRNQSTDNGVTRVNGGGTYPPPLPPIGGSVQSPAFTTITNNVGALTMANGSTVTIVNSKMMLTPVGGGSTPAASQVAGSINVPWAIGFLPDGTFLVTQRDTFSIRHCSAAGATLGSFAIPNTVTTGGEGGLMGLAIDPNFAVNNFIYVCHTRTFSGGYTPGGNEVIRYTLNAAANTISAGLILITYGSGAFHNGGALGIGPDGMLYITTGNGTSPNNTSQVLSGSAINDGKVLRINLDGTKPSDNPFNTDGTKSSGVGDPKTRSAVWTWGHRNPQGICWDANGNCWGSENGPTGEAFGSFSGIQGNDKINLLRKGINYGFPLCYGPNTAVDSFGVTTQAPVLTSGNSEVWAPEGIAYFNGSIFFCALGGIGGLPGTATLNQFTINTVGGATGSIVKRLNDGHRKRAAMISGGLLYYSTSDGDGRGAQAAGTDVVNKIDLTGWTGAAPMGVTSSVVKAEIDGSTPGIIYYASNDPSFAGQPGGLGWFLWNIVTLVWTASSDPQGGQVTQPSTLAIYNFIKGLAGNHVIVGQHIASAANGTRDSDAFVTLTGKHVAMLGDGYWAEFSNGDTADIAGVNARFTQQWNAGGLVYLDSFYPSPADQSGLFGNADILQCITVGSAQYNRLHSFYDQEIAGLLALQTAGVIVINRAFLECKFTFWWGIAGGGTTNWTDTRFITLFQQRVTYFRSKGVQNVLYVYSQGFNAGDGSGHNTYPGDTFVDFQGEDVYTNNITDYFSLYSNELAQHPTKPWIMAEWGSNGPSNGDSTFDMNRLINDIKNSMPATVMFDAWDGNAAGHGWSIAAMSNVVAAMNNPYALVRENLGRP